MELPRRVEEAEAAEANAALDGQERFAMVNWALSTGRINPPGEKPRGRESTCPFAFVSHQPLVRRPEHGQLNVLR